MTKPTAFSITQMYIARLLNIHILPRVLMLAKPDSFRMGFPPASQLPNHAVLISTKPWRLCSFICRYLDYIENIHLRPLLRDTYIAAARKPIDIKRTAGIWNKVIRVSATAASSSSTFMDVPRMNSSRIFQDAAKKISSKDSKNNNQSNVYSIVGAIWSVSERTKQDGTKTQTSPWCLSQTLCQ